MQTEGASTVLRSQWCGSDSGAALQTCIAKYVALLNLYQVTFLFKPGTSYWHMNNEPEKSWVVFPALLCLLFIQDPHSVRSVVPDRARPGSTLTCL